MSSKCNSENNIADNNNPAAPPLDPVVVSLLKSTFMKLQKKGKLEEQLQYAQLGHEHEDVFINKFYNHDGGQQGVGIKAFSHASRENLISKTLLMHFLSLMMMRRYLLKSRCKSL